MFRVSFLFTLSIPYVQAAVPTQMPTKSPTIGLVYTLGQKGTNNCPSFSQTINDAAHCLVAAKAVYPGGNIPYKPGPFNNATAVRSGAFSNVPTGCVIQNAHPGGQWAPHFNTDVNGINDGGYSPLCVTKKLYYDGPHVGDNYATCTSWYGTLAEAEARCNTNASCGWLRDSSCDAKNWRTCGAEGVGFSNLPYLPWNVKPGACTKVTSPYPKPYFDGTVPAPVPGDLILNGNFSEGQDTDTFVYLDDDIKLPHWATVGKVVRIRTEDSRWGFVKAVSGMYFTALHQIPSSLFQAVATRVGAIYILTWYERTRPRYAARNLSVTANDAAVYALHNVPTSWTNMSVTFTATSALTIIKFHTPGGPTDGSVFVDGISCHLQSVDALVAIELGKIDSAAPGNSVQINLFSIAATGNSFTIDSNRSLSIGASTKVVLKGGNDNDRPVTLIVNDADLAGNGTSVKLEGVVLVVKSGNMTVPNGSALALVNSTIKVSQLDLKPGCAVTLGGEKIDGTVAMSKHVVPDPGTGTGTDVAIGRTCVRLDLRWGGAVEVSGRVVAERGACVVASVPSDRTGLSPQSYTPVFLTRSEDAYEPSQWNGIVRVVAPGLCDKFEEPWSLGWLSAMRLNGGSHRYEMGVQASKDISDTCPGSLTPAPLPVSYRQRAINAAWPAIAGLAVFFGILTGIDNWFCDGRLRQKFLRCVGKFPCFRKMQQETVAVSTHNANVESATDAKTTTNPLSTESGSANAEVSEM